MRVLSLIIKREYMARVRNRSFLVMTFLSPLILVGMIALITYLSQVNNDTTRTIAFLDETGLFGEEFFDTEKTSYVNLSEANLEKAKQLVEAEEYYGLIFIPEQVANADFEGAAIEQIVFYGEESPSISLLEDIERRLEKRLTNRELVERGVDLNVLDASKASIDITIENYTGEQTSKMSSWIKAAFGGAAGYLLMMFIIIYGNMVMRSVIEEKTNRIIEVIISSVKPFQLMMGKILGTTLAGITQFTIWVIVGGILLTVVSSYFGMEAMTAASPQAQAMATQDLSKMELIVADILRLPLGQLTLGFLIYFIGGYFLYSSIYASIGAAVDNETDTQQFMLPVILPLMLGIYVGFFAVIENPHGTVSTAFSMIPLTSPIVMLMRIPFGVPWYELIISVLLLIGSFAFTVWLGAKIYRVGILMYGKKPTYKELFKWLKY
ncbi:ABC transporter permease [Croceiramulus getboli]|nr:ABC transporter permease [Flavobacteriaceae bacterium YJPT1-3]